jgi:Na+-transporting NADH:ubiquinone oxidoreductase subunit B
MIRGIWDRETVALLRIASLLPVALLWAQAAVWGGIWRGLGFLALVALWQGVWMVVRAQPPSMSGLLTALALAVLAPEGLGPVALILGASFGIVMAEQAFGGWGRNILNPATVALAFLGFGFPAAPWPDLAVQVGWAALPALLVGVVLGVGSLRLMLGTALVLAGAHVAGVDLSPALTAILVAMALLVSDPVASAATPAGRWANGAMFGALVILFELGWQEADPLQRVVAAALLASLVAPLLDEIAIAAWRARRRKRLG